MMTIALGFAFLMLFLFLSVLLFMGMVVIVDRLRNRRIDLLAHSEICKLNQMFYTIEIEGVTYVPRDFDRSRCTGTSVYRCELAFDFDSAGGNWRSDSSSDDWESIFQGSSDHR